MSLSLADWLSSIVRRFEFSVHKAYTLPLGTTQMLSFHGTLSFVDIIIVLVILTVDYVNRMT